MNEKTMEEILNERMERDRVERRLCDAAGADYELAQRSASLCSFTITRASAEYGEGWWSKLQEEAERRREQLRQSWSKQIDDAFRRVISQGSGPVSAIDLGWEYVRSKVPESLLVLCDRWSSERRGGLLLCGKAESGKTMALLSLAWRLHWQANPIPSRYDLVEPPGIIQTPVVWTQAVQLANERTSWKFGTERPDFELLCEQAKVLVIDDLFFANHRIDVILEIAAARMNRSLPTLTTCGFGEDEIRTRLGDSGLRRLVRCGQAAGIVLQLNG